MDPLITLLIITALGVLYIISPIDIVPDFLPIVGWADDLIVAVIITFLWISYFAVQAVLMLTPILMLISIVFIATIVLYFVYKTFGRRKRRR